MNFIPDFRHIVAAAENRKSTRLPLYEHNISPLIMEKILDVHFAEMLTGNAGDIEMFFKYYCEFFQKMTYDTVSCEMCITEILPGHGALMGGIQGPIQTRKDFENYPWKELPDVYWHIADSRFSALLKMMPAGMKAVGGIGNGIFEISEDLVGYEYLSYMQVDDPELFADIYVKIGDLMLTLWKRFVAVYGQSGFCLYRFGDDLGFKTGLLPTLNTFKAHILPQYRRIISFIKKTGTPFLWHSCGSIFEIMDDMIAAGINAKHSNEDQIAPFDKWIELYGDKIGLFGGIDVSLLCQASPDEIYAAVLENGSRFRQNALGYAIGSGNSIPEYIPVEGYLAMIGAVRQIRKQSM